MMEKKRDYLMEKSHYIINVILAGTLIVLLWVIYEILYLKCQK